MLGCVFITFDVCSLFIEGCFVKYPHLRRKKVNEVEEDEEEPQEEREESVNAMFSKN